MIRPTRQPIRRPIRLPRETREGERLWNDHNVDKNLDDGWLDALNALKCYDLINICEGHVNGNRGSRPHVYLQIKGDILPIFMEDFDNISRKLRSSCAEIFDTVDTTVKLEFHMNLTALGARQESGRKLWIRFESKLYRQSIEMEQDVVKWFNKSIKNIGRFDVVTQSLLAGGSSDRH